MSMFSIFDIAASGMASQNVRLNTIASNLANANTASSTPEAAYKAKNPVFQTILVESAQGYNKEGRGVFVKEIVESKAEVKPRYEPSHPLADEEGYVYYPNVNVMEEMANMISSTRSFESNAKIADTAKTLMERTLSMGS